MKIQDSRILALDIGSVRIGLAIWNPESQLAQCLPHRKRRKLAEDLEFFDRLIREQNVQALLVGLPYALSGNKTPSTENALFWIDTLKEKFELPVYSHDESFSSKNALEILQDKSPAKKKILKDSLSAALFLEDFIREKKGLT